ncbi:helix-turn-helix domain-containing protein [Lacibacter sp. H407]|uniref:helix-turn-helix domain-containing protein n=1 Tax=Lacibacter sp. H407 TaxID=3133423 RepID=UPI0030C01BFE
MLLKVKNMICQRCIIVIHEILEELGFEPKSVQVGEIVLNQHLTEDELEQLDTALKKTGLALVYTNDELIVQKIKHVIFEIVHYSNEPLLEKLSTYLSNRLNYSYTYLANIFKKINGIPIEQFVITEKIRKVKMLLISEQLTLSEIAYKMNYSSVAHLSSQFKKVTGIRASDFKVMYVDASIEMPELIPV